MIASVLLMSMPVITIYVASHLAMDQEDEDNESLTTAEVMLFPVLGTCSLIGLYLMLKYQKEYLEMFMNLYISFIGVGALFYCFQCIPVGFAKDFHVKFSYKDQGLIELRSSWLDPALFATSVGILRTYMISKNWLLSNVIAVSFAIITMRIAKIDSIRTGIALLFALFLYDIFFVFGTEVMVTVAKGLEYPIKIMMPRQLVNFSWTYLHNPSILGLGDIVVPGMFITRYISKLKQMLAFRFATSQKTRLDSKTFRIS